MRSFSFRFIWLLVVSGLIATVWIAFERIPQSPTRDSFLGNLLATIIGIFVGIPIALEVNEYQTKLQAKTKRLEEEHDKRERQERILNLIKGELEYNRNLLSVIVEEQKENPTVVVFDGLKNDLWLSFSDGGELQSVDDLELIDSLSWAYYYLRILIPLEEKYFDPDFLLGVEHTGTDGSTSRTYKGARIVQRTTSIRPNALLYIDGALAKIQKSLKSTD